MDKRGSNVLWELRVAHPKTSILMLSIASEVSLLLATGLAVLVRVDCRPHCASRQDFGELLFLLVELKDEKGSVLQIGSHDLPVTVVASLASDGLAILSIPMAA